MSDATDNLGAPEEPASEEAMALPLPPNVKHGIAVMELFDGTIIRFPISPSGVPVSMGVVMRMLVAEVDDIGSQILASRIAAMIKKAPPEGPGGLIDLP